MNFFSKNIKRFIILNCTCIKKEKKTMKLSDDKIETFLMGHPVPMLEVHNKYTIT